MDNQTTIAPHLSTEQLKNYLSDQLNEAQSHQVEKHLLSCALCADAMEGLSENIPNALSEDLPDLEQRLNQRIAEKKKGGPMAWPYYRAAAVVVLLMLSGVVFYFLSFDKNTSESGLTIDQKELAPSSDQEVLETTDDKAVNESTASSLIAGQKSEGAQEEVNTDQPLSGEVVQNEPTATTSVPISVSRSERDQVTKEGATNKAAQPTLADAGISQEAVLSESEAEVAQEDAIEEARSPAPEIKTRSKLAYKPLDPRRGDLLPQAIVPPDPYRTIVGKVISSESGRPLAGIRVEVKNTKFSTFTDNEGDYILAAPLEAQALIMTYQGYRSQELPLGLDQERKELTYKLADSVASGFLDDDPTGDSLNLGTRNYTLAREDTEPIPEGGMEAYTQYLAASTQRTKANFGFFKKRSIAIEVSFIVQPDGRLTDFELSKESPDCKDQVIGKILNGPKWVAGTSDAKKAAKPVILSVSCDL